MLYTIIFMWDTHTHVHTHASIHPNASKKSQFSTFYIILSNLNRKSQFFFFFFRKCDGSVRCWNKWLKRFVNGMIDFINSFVFAMRGRAQLLRKTFPDELISSSSSLVKRGPRGTTPCEARSTGGLIPRCNWRRRSTVVRYRSVFRSSVTRVNADVSIRGFLGNRTEKTALG